MIRAQLPIAVLLVTSLLAPACSAATAPDIEPLLSSGNLEEVDKQLSEYLENTEDDLARFQLGTVRFLRAVETLVQDTLRYGTTDWTGQIPFLRLGRLARFDGVANKPEPVTYNDIRELLERFQGAVAEAEATLKPIKDPDLFWRLNFDEVALDFNGDGKRQESESLNTIFCFATGQLRRGTEAPKITVGFDSADVQWLRGYCHVLQALVDIVLAYDHEPLFEGTAHAFFVDPQTEYARERRRSDGPIAKSEGIFNFENLSDALAAIHLIDFKLREPRRLQSAREHLLQVIALSRVNWAMVLAEDDNRQEWIPGPNQKSVIPRLTSSGARLEAWRRFLEEAEAILNGELLIPYWRSGFKEGINLKRVFTEPRDFDLILWIQGTAAMPYLERGEKTSPEVWEEFQRIFRGEFLGFAVWVN